jgi:hypothetical protein
VSDTGTELNQLERKVANTRWLLAFVAVWCLGLTLLAVFVMWRWDRFCQLIALTVLDLLPK